MQCHSGWVSRSGSELKQIQNIYGLENLLNLILKFNLSIISENDFSVASFGVLMDLIQNCPEKNPTKPDVHKLSFKIKET